MSIVYGYCRISTGTQNIERQVRNILEKFPKAHIVKEIFTGTKFQGRKELDKILKIVKPKDTIVFDSVSRMSRNADEGCELYKELFKKGVNLIFLNEPHINTEVYQKQIEKQIKVDMESADEATKQLVKSIVDALNEYSLNVAQQQIIIAFQQAQKEVDDLHERTRQGMLTAKLNGKQIGLPKGTTYETKKAKEKKKEIIKYSRDFNGSLNDLECRKLIGIAENTFYKYKREIREELAGE